MSPHATHNRPRRRGAPWSPRRGEVLRGDPRGLVEDRPGSARRGRRCGTPRATAMRLSTQHPVSWSASWDTSSPPLAAGLAAVTFRLCSRASGPTAANLITAGGPAARACRMLNAAYTSDRRRAAVRAPATRWVPFPLVHLSALLRCHVLSPTERGRRQGRRCHRSPAGRRPARSSPAWWPRSAAGGCTSRSAASPS